MGFLDTIKTFTSGLVPMSLGIQFLKKTVEDMVGFKVEWYELHYNQKDNEVFFNIPYQKEVRKYPFKDTNGLVEMAKEKLTEYLTEGDTVDYVILIHKPNDIQVKLYYTDKEGQKQYVNKQL